MTKGGVLLLGGDLRLQQSVRAALESANYEVLPARNRSEAQEFVDVGLVEILVVDSDSTPERVEPWLGQLTGEGQQIRVIGLHEPRKGGAKADVASVSVWLEKPLRPGRLLAAINDLLAARQAEVFREELRRRQTAPLFDSMGYRHWGLNE